MQKQVLDLLLDLTDELDKAMLLITHDLGVVAEVADDVLVMCAGRVGEQGPVLDVFDRPCHPYTLGLQETTPDPAARGRLRAIPGIPASGVDRPPGCPFHHPHCRFAVEVGQACSEVVPLLVERHGDPSHVAACHLPPGRSLR